MDNKNYSIKERNFAAFFSLFLVLFQVLLWISIHSFSIDKGMILSEKSDIVASLGNENRLLEKKVAAGKAISEIIKKSEELSLSPVKVVILSSNVSLFALQK